MWTTNYLSPQTEMEDFDLFPPFAKRSQKVNRHSEERAFPVQLPCDDTFWSTDMPPPCEESFRFESFLAPAFSSPAGMISGRKGVNASLTHEKLPHPSKLMGRKKGGRRQLSYAANVQKYMQELRMRQNYINQLKEDKWWGATDVSHPEESGGQQDSTSPGNEQLLGFPAHVHLSEMLMENPDETITKPYQADSSLTSQFLSSGYEQFLDLTPGGNPMMAFAAGTAQRSPLMADDVTIIDQSKLWGI